MAITKLTPHEHAHAILHDRDGGEILVVLTKASFTLSSDGTERHATPLPVFLADRRAANGATRYPSDVALRRQGTDVVCLGTVQALGGVPAPSRDVTVEVGPLAQTVRAFGPRTWLRDRGGWRASSPAAFATLSLGFEAAFGGPGTRENPVGVGWIAEGASIEGAPLPRLEDPEALIQTPYDRPPPSCFGAVAPHWLPRARFAGTYDDAWARRRAPLLPDDFDDRFFNVALPGLMTSTPLTGGEKLKLVNLSPTGTIETVVPRVALRVQFDDQIMRPSLDLVLIEPDEDRVSLTFRSTFDITGRIDRLPRVRIYEPGVAPLGQRASQS